MNKKDIPALLALAVTACVPNASSEAPAPSDSIIVNIAEKGAEVSPGMYGIFLEEINHGCDGGLNAELVENRSFESLDMPEGYHVEGDRLIAPLTYHHIRQQMIRTDHPWPTDPVPGWTLEGAATMAMSKDAPLFESAPNNLNVSIDGQAVLTNDGYWGMNLQKGENYDFRIIVKPCEGSSIIAKLLSESGEVLAECPVQADKVGEWNDISTIISPNGSSEKGSLALAIEGKGDISFDYVSLMPGDRYSYNGVKLPLRKDVAEMLVGLKPAFVRWPGGCVVEGISLSNRFEWKKSIGDPASRPGNYNLWGYHTSYGIGYHDYLSFCESIGAKALFVCNAGISCNGRLGELCCEEDIDFYIDECMDAIEYAIGPVDSEWGALRAQAGHPEPFPLGYVEIGNENEGLEYERHYNIFHKAIREKYPELILICNNGMFGKGTIEETDMIDPHWYIKPSFFFQNTHLFDGVERGQYTAYVGEYAVNSEVGNGNLRASLAEAAWMGGMERNGDFVQMCSYAPLLENSNDRFWPVNLIWTNSSQVMGRASYYVQKLFAENRPDYNVVCSAYESPVENPGYQPGRITLGTNQTISEFKDIKVTTAEGKESTIDLNSFKPMKGDWTCKGGVLRQNNPITEHSLCTFDGIYEGNYSIDLKFRRISGSEGCYVGFAMDEKAGNGYRCSIGGWDDGLTMIEHVMGGGFSEGGVQTFHSVIDEGEWQDVHVDVANGTSTLYIDGNKVADHKVVTESDAYYTTGYDEKNSEAVLKLVNRTGEVYPLNVTLEGARSVSRRGAVITLTSASDTDENSFEEPGKVVPVVSTWNGFAKNFTYELEPYSFTILRIKTKK